MHEGRLFVLFGSLEVTRRLKAKLEAVLDTLEDIGGLLLVWVAG